MRDDGEIVRVQSARHAIEGERCRAEVDGGFTAAGDIDTTTCNRPGVWTIVSHTRHVGSDRVRRRTVAFCDSHVPRRFASLVEWQTDARNPHHAPLD